MLRLFLRCLAGLALLTLALPVPALALTNPAGPAPVPGVAAITSPVAGAHVHGLVPVTGSADWPNATAPYNFASYTLDFGSGRNPSSFTTFDTGQTAVSNAQLGSFNTAALPDGPYVIRLSSANNTGNYVQAVVPVVVDNSGTYAGPTFPVSDPAPVPGGKGPSVILLNSSSYTDPISNQLRIVGEAQNNGNVNLQFVQVSAAFKDAGGNVLQTGIGFTALPILVPGQTSPFEIFTLAPAGASGPPALSVTFDTTATPPAGGLAISSDAMSYDAQGQLHLTGIVTNSRPASTTAFRVAYAVHNAAGTTLRAGTFNTVTGQNGQIFSLAPGTSGAFDFVVPNPPSGATSDSLAIQ